MNESKITILSGSDAGIIQSNAEQYNCKVIELGLVGGGNARITIEGTAEDLQKLFALIEPKNEG